MAIKERILVSTVIEAFEKAVAANPQGCAVRLQDAKLTYGELDALSNFAAARLLQAGACTGDRIGIQMRREINLIVMLLAILKAGCGFCFISPRNPQSWNNSVIEKAEVRLFIANGPLCNVTFAEPLQSADLMVPVTVGCSRKPAASDIVYVNFSSGTTGAPKIIPCTHLGVVGFCYQPPHFPAGPQTVMIHHSALTFDASQFEIWTALCNGGCLVLTPEDHLTGDTLRQIIAESGANTLWLTTSLLNMLMDADPECLAGISYIMVGGEALSPGHIDRLYRHNARITVYNGYGPTENTMGTCVYRIPRDHDFSRAIPIGYPVHDSRLYILNEEGEPCETGEVGELVIAGDGLSPGYVGDACLTESIFRAFPQLGEVRAYASGDLVFRDSCGLFHYAGRKDDQVKIRGNRTSLSDIALAYGRHPGVANCVGGMQSTPTGKRVLLYYVAQSASRPPEDAELKDFGMASLPDFMVPDRFVQVAFLPVTPHGKIDMAALAKTAAEQDQPAGSRHWLLEACGLADWRPDQDFFQAGGHSILAVKLVTLLNRHRREPLGLTEFYRDCTWSRMARLLAEIGDEPKCDLEWDAFDYHIIRLKDERAVPPWPEIATLTLPTGLFAFVYARGAQDAARLLADRQAPLTSDRYPELTDIPLTPMQASMVYPELFHGHLTANNVAYLVKPGSQGKTARELEEIAQSLSMAFPLLTAVVVDGEHGLAFRLPATGISGERLVFSVAQDFTDERDCVSFLLNSPISLFEGPLLRLVDVHISGQRHIAVLFHHILADHLGQVQLLRSLTASLAAGHTDDETTLPDLAFVAENLKLEKRYADVVEQGIDFWAHYGERAVVSGPRQEEGGPTWRQAEIVLPETQYTRLQWAAMRAYRHAITKMSGTTDPLALCLFSHRSKKQGLGFYTVAAPILFEDDLLGGREMPDDFHDRMEAFRSHSLIGSEEIQTATGWDAERIPYLFNFVAMPEEDLLWLRDSVLDVPSENPRTNLDMTFIAAGAQRHLHIASRLDDETLTPFLACFLETLKESL
ncbi:hypothetical protein DDT56_13720 [Brenneria corticis]|uniref:Carrier domain-containing protein n=1 Tax=Brenneria corticis TaxID=2173106 RepID=A0A2U1TYS3_9GAMM|nr:hypothetical protein DDT56_13720 [Brenneria sp. CFCC 11842]